MGKTDVARQSIEAVYRNNTGSLSRFLPRFLDSRVEIEDMLQEAFLKALEAERKTDIETPLPFLFKTARNLALNTIARYRRQRTDPITDFDELPVLMDLRLISNLNPESEALVDEQLRFASEAVEQLTPRVREVFILRIVYGLTHKEIAARLGITVSTVEKHIVRGVLQVGRRRNLHEPDRVISVRDEQYASDALGEQAES